MKVKKYTNEEMMGRIVRFKDLKEHGIPLMFIDSILPGHHRMNYPVIGDTASENPDFEVDVAIRSPHQFQIGMVMAPPGNGPAYHTHDYIEAFMPLTGRWRYYWGNSPEEIEGEAILEPWDWISLPAGLWRGFENISEEDAWLVGVLEPHDVFTGKDPHWSSDVVEKAGNYGFEADEKGKMIKPGNYEQIVVQLKNTLLHKDEKK
jgi:quercetin dioxygenase-like cupin family protein